MNATIAIKPHHFVDILTDIGGGTTSWEPHPYGHAVHTVAGALLANRDATVRIELGADDICAPCVHNVDGVCVDTIDTSYRPDAPESKREWNFLIGANVWKSGRVTYCLRRRCADGYATRLTPRTTSTRRCPSTGTASEW